MGRAEWLTDTGRSTARSRSPDTKFASDVTGATVPAGFTRIVAFRSGLLGDEDLCNKRFG